MTGAKLQAMFVVEDRDYYSDRTVATTNQDEAFLAFQGDRPVEHYLYICCEEIFNLPEVTTAAIAINTDSPESAVQLKELLHIWAYWDNKKWQPLANVQTEENEAQLTVNLTHLPKLMPVEINGQKAKWLRTISGH